MSGWEDLIEEAGGDLERLEGHVAAAAERLVALQVKWAQGSLRFLELDLLWQTALLLCCLLLWGWEPTGLGSSLFRS